MGKRIKNIYEVKSKLIIFIYYLTLFSIFISKKKNIVFYFELYY